MQLTSSFRRLAERIELPQVRTRSAVPIISLVVLGAPLALGGAPAVTVPVFAAISTVALFATGFTRETVLRDPVLVMFFALLATSFVQLVPLPPFVLDRLDPVSALASGRALDALHVNLSHTWRALHFDPGTGTSDAVYFLGLASLYFATKRAVIRDALETLYIVCASSALVIALLGIAHLITGQDRVYGFYTPAHALPPILSPLLNANHLAALTGAGAILWIGQAVELRPSLERILAALAALLCAATCALTLSRGGVASAVGGVAIFAALNARRPREGHKRPRNDSRPLLGAFLGVAVVSAGLYVAATSLGQEYHRGDASKLENFRRALGLLRHRELLGVGSGGVTGAATLTARLDPDFTFLRVESLPVDLAVSFGVITASAAMYFGFRALRRWWPPADVPATALAAWAALVSIVVHDFVDFALYLGGVGYFAATLGGILAGQHARKWKVAVAPEPSRVIRWPALVVALIIAMLAPTAYRSTLEADRDRFEQDLRAHPDAYRRPSARAIFRRHPTDAYLRLLAGAYAIGQRDPDALRFVNSALELAPSWAQPHLLLVRVFGARNIHSQTLVEVREALERSRSIGVAYPCADVVARLSPPPTADEIDRAAPALDQGLWFLEHLAEARGVDPELASEADTLQLARDPSALGPMLRKSGAAFMQRDLALAERYCSRLMRTHPREAYGYTCESRVLEQRGDIPGALASLHTAISRVSDAYALHAEVARIAYDQRDLATIRRETDRMVEAAGSDLARRAGAYGLRGDYEFALGNPSPAYDAYQTAEQLSVPEHPYLLAMARAARAMNDRHALEAACAVLMEADAPSAAATALCSHPVRSGILGGSR